MVPTVPWILPKGSGHTTLTAFCTQCATTASLLGIEDVVVFNDVSIISADDKTLTPFARIVRVGDWPKHSRRIARQFRAHYLLLTQTVGTVADIATPEAFAKFVTAWIPAGTSMDVGQLQDPFYLYQRYSHDKQFGPLPCWTGDVYYVGMHQHYSVPRASVSNPSEHFYAETAGVAAVKWLEDPYLKDVTSGGSTIRVLLRDPRAHLQALRRVESDLIVEVRGQPDREYVLFVAAVDDTGQRHEGELRIDQDLMAAVGLSPRRLDQITISLTDASGFELDQYMETSAMPNWANLIPRPRNARHALDALMPSIGLAGAPNTMEHHVHNYNMTNAQIGSVGPGAHAHDLSMVQHNTIEAADIDLAALAHELSQLRAALAPSASMREHYAALVEVSDAEAAAKAGDKSKALAHLKRAGAWVLDLAQKIAVPVAAAALEHAAKLK